MRTLLVTLLLMVALVVGVGFYRGWFAASWDNNNSSDQVDMQVHVNKERIREDVNQVKKQVADTAQQVRDQVNQTSDKLENATSK
jgi:hypothetical protein